MLLGVEFAYCGDRGFDGCYDPIGGVRDAGVQISTFDVHRCHYHVLDYCDLEDECEGEGLDGGAVCWWLGDLSANAGSGKHIASGGCACLVFVRFAVAAFLALAFECCGYLPGAEVVFVLEVGAVW